MTRFILATFLVATASCMTTPPTLSAGDAVNTAADRDHKDVG